MALIVSTENNLSNLIASINVTDSDSIFLHMGDYCQKQLWIEEESLSYIKVEEFQRDLIDKDNIDSTDEKTQIQNRIDEYTKLMILYYLMAIEEGSVIAMNKLGRYYQEYGYKDENYELLMIKYYKMAIINGSSYAMRKMGHYVMRKNYSKDGHHWNDIYNLDQMAFHFYKMAFLHGDIKAAYYLGRYYQYNEPNKILMKKYYLIAIENISLYYKGTYNSINYIKSTNTEDDCCVCYETKQMYATPCQRHSICIDCSIMLIGEPCPMCRGTCKY